jgi:hypothetical protein
MLTSYAIAASSFCSGTSGHVAARLSSLLPKPYGTGTRNNAAKREYVLAHLSHVEYRTIALPTTQAAEAFERDRIKANRASYLFGT